jgi:hypothetical protein
VSPEPTSRDRADSQSRAAKIFTYSLPLPLTTHIHSLKVSLHGSLAATGMGHMTPHSVLLGLMGEDPESVQVGRLEKVMEEVGAVGEIELGLQQGTKRVKFNLERDLVSGQSPRCELWSTVLLAAELHRRGTSTLCLRTRTGYVSPCSTRQGTCSRRMSISQWEGGLWYVGNEFCARS